MWQEKRFVLSTARGLSLGPRCLQSRAEQSTNYGMASLLNELFPQEDSERDGERRQEREEECSH